MVFLLVLFGLIAVCLWYSRSAQRQRQRRLRDFLAPGDRVHRPTPLMASRHGVPAPRKPVQTRNRSRGKIDDEDDDDLGPVEKTPAVPDAVPAFYDESYTTLRSRRPPAGNRGRRNWLDGASAVPPASAEEAYDAYLRSPQSSSRYDASPSGSPASAYGGSSSCAPDTPASSDSASDTSSWFGSGSSSSSGSSGWSGSSCSSDSDSSDD